ncbi:MAG TPA: hypothetical protein VGI78_01790 [Acetobacteraceae bacterium]|jgi:uncharacterized membrane-anchored protein
MSTDLVTVGGELVEVLAAENAALAVLDLPRAVGLLPDKRRATEGFVAAQRVAIATAQRDAAERLFQRLQSLAEENKALLTRAMAAQSRVIGVIARAAAPTGYGAAPTYGRGARPVAFAFVARA